MAKQMVEIVFIELDTAPRARRKPSRIEPPLKSTQQLIDKLVELTQKYGDLPPVIVAGVDTRASIRRVEVCGGQDHILIEAIPEQE